MFYPFLICLSAVMTCTPLTVAQEQSTAIEMSEQCAANWNEYESVRCNFVVTTELPTGRTVGTGDCLFVGGRARITMAEEKLGFSMVMVAGDRYAWTEMRVSGDQPGMEVVKYFRGQYDYERETLIGMSGASPILHHPSRIFRIVARNYDLALGSKQAEAKTLLVSLEGDLKPGCRREDLGRRLSAEERKIIERMIRCRFTVRAEDFLPVRVDFFRGEGDGPTLSLQFTDYRLNVPHEDLDFEYTPPEGVPVNNRAARRQAQFRLPPLQAKPELPLADSASFHSLSDETRVDVLIMPEGSFKVGNRSCDDFNGVYGALWWASTFFGRDQNPDALPLADVDVVVYAAPETDIDGVLTLLQAGATNTVGINRFYLAVQDREKNVEGYLPFYLPADVGVRPGSGTSGASRPDRFDVTIGGRSSGPEYTVERMSTDEKWSFNNLEELASSLEAIRETDRAACIVCAISVRPRGRDRSDSRPITTGHLADFLDLLASHGADLTRESAGALVNEREIIEALPGEDK